MSANSITNSSKSISKSDDSGKEFIMGLLEGDNTHGFDIDSIYHTKNGWVVIELLKCDTISPHESHPHRYPYNWKKFASLIEVKKKLKGELWLVNYSTKEDWKQQVRLFIVNNIDYESIKKYVNKDFKSRPKFLEYMTISEDHCLTYEQFKNKYRELNRNATQPWGE